MEEESKSKESSSEAVKASSAFGSPSLLRMRGRIDGGPRGRDSKGLIKRLEISTSDS